MTKLPIQETLADDHLMAIGLVITQWASLERLMIHAICDLIANKPLSPRRTLEDAGGLMAVSGIGARVMIGLLETLTVLRFGENDAKTLKKLLERIQKCKDVRDILAHAIWETGTRPGFVKPKGMKTVGIIRILEGETNTAGIAGWAFRTYERGRDLRQFFHDRGLLKID